MIETLVEMTNGGAWISDKRVEELAKENWELKAFGYAIDMLNEYEKKDNDIIRYVFQRKVEP